METDVAWTMTGMSTLFDRDTVEGFMSSKRSRLESEQKSEGDFCPGVDNMDVHLWFRFVPEGQS
jgi:hypothetical protein